MPKKSQNSDKFRFMTEKSIRQEKFELTRWQSAQLRSKLSKGIYWVRLEKSIYWNWVILQDYMVNGDGPHHQNLIDEYVATLHQAT